MMPSELPPPILKEPIAEPAPDAQAVDQRPLPHRAPARLAAVFEGHLHPLTLLFSMAKAIRGFLLPLIPLLVFGNKFVTAAIVIGLFGLTIGQALARYFTFSYRIEGGDLIIREGILERTERHIPLERVQEIRIEQGVVQRLFQVVEATVQTAGGSGPEASLSVLARAEAERLRQAVFEGAAVLKADAQVAVASPSVVAEPRQIIHRLSLADLIKAGLTSNHLLSALLLVGAAWNLVDDLLPESLYARLEGIIEEQISGLVQQELQAAIAIALLSVLLILLIGMAFSVLGSIVLFFNFTLSKLGEDLHRSYGLLTKRASSLPRRRIQVLEIEESFLRRLFRLATVRADNVGTHKRARSDDNKGRDVLIPVIARDRVEALLPVFFPDIAAEPYEWQSVSRIAIWRSVGKALPVCALLSALWFWRWPSALALLPFVLLLVWWWVSAKSYRSMGYAMGGNYFRTRRGWLGRSTHIVPTRKIQAVEVSRNLLDRWLGVATLFIDTAGQAYTGGGPRITNLPAEEARHIARLLAHRAAAMEYKVG